MLTVVLVVSLANLLLNVIAVLQRHKAIQLAKAPPDRPGPNDPGPRGRDPRLSSNNTSRTPDPIHGGQRDRTGAQRQT